MASDRRSSPNSRCSRARSMLVARDKRLRTEAGVHSVRAAMRETERPSK